MDPTLFPVGPQNPKNEEGRQAGVPRLERPVRNQVEMISSDLEGLLPDDHQARTVWNFVEQADLSELYANIRAVEGHAGRAAIDPRILLALWLYATLDGVGSARALNKLCEDSVPYRWICGGVSINHHTLSDFRSQSGAVMDELLTDSIAMMRAKNLVTLNRVAHDGVRVRAGAGSGSFRREQTLERHLEEAGEQVDALRQELDADPGAGELRRKAARERAARERQERIAEALRQYPDVKKKKKNDKEQARVSMTDPDARIMHMADGGFRPAYNVQLSTDTASQMIVNVDIIQSGSDSGQLQTAVEQIQERHELTPKEFLVDGGYVKQEAIEKLSAAPQACLIYAPVPAPRGRPGNQQSQPFKAETSHVTAWRERMETEQAKKIYKERAATAECVNAQARNRGLQQFTVRGLKKVRAVVLLFALAHNLMRMVSLLRKAVEPCPSG